MNGADFAAKAKKAYDDRKAKFAQDIFDAEAALERKLVEQLAAREKDGFDFWWIDWQQGEAAGNTGQDGPRYKMNPTIWTDKMRVTDPIRQGVNKRGVVLARFGGLGNHRYQHGFSGDVKGLTWSNLAYQPYFSMTASNVLYGFWSHDIEGPRSCRARASA